MDPFTMMAIASVPTLAGMFMPKPGMPGPSGAYGVSLPDRSGYQNQMLQTGFSPNSQLYQIASQQGLANINNDLASKGVGYSSMGNMALSAAQAQMANEFLKSETQRQIASFNAATGYDIAGANTKLGIAGAQNQDAWARYNAANTNQQGFYNGLSGLASAGLGAYGMSSMQDQIAKQQQQQQSQFNAWMSPANGNAAGGPYSAPPGMNYGLGANTNFGPPAQF